MTRYLQLVHPGRLVGAGCPAPRGTWARAPLPLLQPCPCRRLPLPDRVDCPAGREIRASNLVILQAPNPFMLVSANTKYWVPCREGHLSRSALSLLQPYQPSLSAAWMFQRSMALKRGQLRQTHLTPGGRPARQEGWVPPNQINRLLSCNFAVMQVGSGGSPVCLLIPPAHDGASPLPRSYLAHPPAVKATCNVACWSQWGGT